MIDFQNTQFKLAEVKTKLTVAKARVQRIYGGTNQIMKLLIARTL